MSPLPGMGAPQPKRGDVGDSYRLRVAIESLPQDVRGRVLKQDGSVNLEALLKLAGSQHKEIMELGAQAPFDVGKTIGTYKPDEVSPADRFRAMLISSFGGKDPTTIGVLEEVLGTQAGRDYLARQGLGAGVPQDKYDTEVRARRTAEEARDAANTRADALDRKLAAYGAMTPEIAKALSDAVKTLETGNDELEVRVAALSGERDGLKAKVDGHGAALATARTTAAETLVKNIIGDSYGDKKYDGMNPDEKLRLYISEEVAKGSLGKVNREAFLGRIFGEHYKQDASIDVMLGRLVDERIAPINIAHKESQRKLNEYSEEIKRKLAAAYENIANAAEITAQIPSLQRSISDLSLTVSLIANPETYRFVEALVQKEDYLFARESPTGFVQYVANALPQSKLAGSVGTETEITAYNNKVAEFLGTQGRHLFRLAETELRVKNLEIILAEKESALESKSEEIQRLAKVNESGRQGFETKVRELAERQAKFDQRIAGYDRREKRDANFRTVLENILSGRYEDARRLLQTVVAEAPTLVSAQFYLAAIGVLAKEDGAEARLDEVRAKLKRNVAKKYDPILAALKEHAEVKSKYDEARAELSGLKDEKESADYLGSKLDAIVLDLSTAAYSLMTMHGTSFITYAERLYQFAVRLKPDDKHLRFNLARAMLLNNNYWNAAVAWENLKEDDPVAKIYLGLSNASKGVEVDVNRYRSEILAAKEKDSTRVVDVVQDALELYKKADDEKKGRLTPLLETLTDIVRENILISGNYVRLVSAIIGYKTSVGQDVTEQLGDLGLSLHLMPDIGPELAEEHRYAGLVYRNKAEEAKGDAGQAAEYSRIAGLYFKNAAMLDPERKDDDGNETGRGNNEDKWRIFDDISLLRIKDNKKTPEQATREYLDLVARIRADGMRFFEAVHDPNKMESFPQQGQENLRITENVLKFYSGK